MLDVPGGGDHDVAGDVHRAVERGDRAARDGRDDLRRPDHRPPERVRAEDRLGDEVVDEILRRVLVHRDLLEHDLALRVEVGEGRREDHVRHHVDRGLQVLVGDARVDDRVLAGGGRVQLAAERVEDLGDLLRAVRARALEEQVLDEVRDAGLRVALVARAGADPEPERDGAHLREALRDDAFARVELGHDVLLSHAVIVTLGWIQSQVRVTASRSYRICTAPASGDRGGDRGQAADCRRIALSASGGRARIDLRERARLYRRASISERDDINRSCRRR